MPTLPPCLNVRFVFAVLAAILVTARAAPAQQPPAARAPRAPAPTGAAPRTVPGQPRPAPAKPPSPPSEFGLAIDVRHLQLRDDLVAPLVHSGFAPGLDVTYAYRGAEHRHDARLGFALGSPANKYDLDADTYSFAVDYAYGYRVYAHPDPAVSLFTGARIGGAGDGAFYPRIDEAHAYWFTRYDLRPQALAELTLDARSRASLSLSFPLFGLVSRPPDPRFYNNDKPEFGYVLGKLHEGLQFRTLNAYAGIDLGLKYRYQVTRSVAESIEYRFAYASTDEPRAVQVLTHSLRVGLHLDPWKW